MAKNLSNIVNGFLAKTKIIPSSISTLTKKIFNYTSETLSKHPKISKYTNCLFGLTGTALIIAGLAVGYSAATVATAGTGQILIGAASGVFLTQSLVKTVNSIRNYRNEKENKILKKQYKFDVKLGIYGTMLNLFVTPFFLTTGITASAYPSVKALHSLSYMFSNAVPYKAALISLQVGVVTSFALFFNTFLDKRKSVQETIKEKYFSLDEKTKAYFTRGMSKKLVDLWEKRLYEKFYNKPYKTNSNTVNAKIKNIKTVPAV